MNKNLNVEETCKALNISRPMLYKLWKNGQGPKAIKIGRRTLVAHADLEAWVDGLKRR